MLVNRYRAATTIVFVVMVVNGMIYVIQYGLVTIRICFNDNVVDFGTLEEYCAPDLDPQKEPYLLVYQKYVFVSLEFLL